MINFFKLLDKLMPGLIEYQRIVEILFDVRPAAGLPNYVAQYAAPALLKIKAAAGSAPAGHQLRLNCADVTSPIVKLPRIVKRKKGIS